MKFGPVPVAEASGAIVAHAVHVGALTLKKGETIAPEHVRVLAEAGVAEVVVARLEAGDVGENEAARQIAGAIGSMTVSIDRAFTGRANLFARASGVLRLDVAAIDRLNAIDESVTVSTLPAFRIVEAGEMVGTVKIIPFAIPAAILDQAMAVAGSPVIDVACFRPLRVAVISTLLPGLKPQVINKTIVHLEARLAPAGARIVADERIRHDAAALALTLKTAVQLADLVVVFGASAITDRRDVIPAAVEAAGGSIQHFGMPVDPGNLLLLAELDGKPVLGAPGCARSPKENGFDWVLSRLLAGIPVTSADIRRLGVGGLLMEIVSRPQPRTADAVHLSQPAPAPVPVEDGAPA